MANMSNKQNVRDKKGGREMQLGANAEERDWETC